MSKVAWLDPFSGAAGDMFLAALLDAGMPFDHLEEQLRTLDLPHWSIRPRSVLRGAISATWLHVETTDNQAQRGIVEIASMISDANLDDAVKELALAMFERLANAEAKVHGLDPKQVHFHEVGAADSIIDIVGAAVGAQWLAADRFIVAPINSGSGQVKTQHGVMPVPAPATLALLSGSGATVYADGPAMELLTPTGALILTSLATGYGPLPPMNIEQEAYGAGSANPPRANVLRLVVGTDSASGPATEPVVILETNIDDASPEQLGYAVERCLAAGALDVWFNPIQMKKFRPAVVLSALCKPDRVGAVEQVIFAETGTLGIRRQAIERRTLERSIATVKTAYGPIRVKLTPNRPGHAAPEYDDVRQAAIAHSQPFADIARAARSAALAEDEN